MDMLGSLLARLVTRWSMSFAGIAIASLLIWYLGPLVPSLAQPLRRALLILLVVFVWACVNAALSWRRRRREGTLAAGITGSGEGHKADAADEVAQLRERVQAAVARLRTSGTRGYLYEQPWFVLIGPPGSGKTTALLNSGLHFPLATDEADARVGGVGGTRLCDWWFADEAVLIDTAGRYTTQDSDASVDRAGWEGFLDLLRRTRPRQPINGALVVISLADIAGADAAERAAHARSIRGRITELSKHLRLRVPVYAVFSKADQLDGFSEYFDDLDAESRAQVWGTTFPLTGGVAGFAAEFRLLLQRLEHRVFERLQAERSPERRARIAAFPLQVASLGPPLEEFLSAAFGGTRLDPAPLLRGVYMISATQEGTPIDRLTGMLARSFGIDQRRAPSLRPAAGRAYFLRRLLRDVVLGEALLVSADPQKRRRRILWRAGNLAAIGLATVLGALLLWHVESTNRLAVEQASEAMAAYHAQLAATPLDPVADDDLPRTVQLLDAAEALPQGAASTLLGLGQQDKLRGSARQAYDQALTQILLPRLIWRLEQQMRSNLADPDFLYQTTRTYLMLGGAGPLDPAVVRDFELRDWASRFAGALNAALRERLSHHLEALLQEPLPAVTLDGALVGAARATFSRVTLAQRVYSRSQAALSDTTTLPAWTPAQALGAAGTPLFARVSGKPLTDGIPGLYTQAGLHALLGNLPAAARAVSGENWVLGPTANPVDAKDPVKLESEVVALYCADVEARWDALLDDLALAPITGHDATVQTLYVLTSPQSPMRDLLTAIVREIAPPVMPNSSKPAAQPDASVAAASGELDRHYAALRTLVGDGSAAPLQSVLHLVDTLQQEIARSGPNAANAPAAFETGGDPVQLLRAEAQRQPSPVARWVGQIAAIGGATLAGNARAAAGSAFGGHSATGDGATSDGVTSPAALCRSVVTGHYPFDPAASADAPLDGFARLFAPNGALDSFFKGQLAPYVDTSRAVWHPEPLAGVAAPADAATVAIFQRAAAIRDAFFVNGGNLPEIRLTAAPLSGTGSLVLGGSTIAAGTATRTDGTPLLWPGADGMATGSVTSGNATLAQVQGPWALFRLVHAGHPTGGGGAVTLAFGAGTQATRFLLTTPITPNPLRASVLEGFHCPVMH